MAQRSTDRLMFGDTRSQAHSRRELYRNARKALRDHGITLTWLVDTDEYRVRSGDGDGYYTTSLIDAIGTAWHIAERRVA